MPKLTAVVGAKHSGKTTIIENVVKQLTSRGYHVGTVKEMVRIPTLDTPETETDRHTQAGAETVVAVPRNETVLFLKKRLPLPDILPSLWLGLRVVGRLRNRKNPAKNHRRQNRAGSRRILRRLSPRHLRPHHRISAGSPRGFSRTRSSAPKQQKPSKRTCRPRSPNCPTCSTAANAATQPATTWQKP
jgi:hypothetical protein